MEVQEQTGGNMSNVDVVRQEVLDGKYRNNNLGECVITPTNYKGLINPRLENGEKHKAVKYLDKLFRLKFGEA